MYKRLTVMNQWGDILYKGKYSKGEYRGMGDYSVNLKPEAIEEIMQRLYFFEEGYEDLTDLVSK